MYRNAGSAKLLIIIYSAIIAVLFLISLYKGIQYS